ncbi:uncharacterized protein IL334_001500 [Kwoniella shivajii]|uniref:Galactinol synthase n=1 Tax=Kwoniella shivajii TaxID=564305 RepID=A0ABZ1CS26_9TREE|nr:hypothetical protein IL334_001500 [Kwoniella shivajii]
MTERLESRSDGYEYAYCTLITRSSYLAGVIILAHTLAKHKTAYPLIVLYTSSLPTSSIRALELEIPHTNLILHQVDPLLPRKNVNVKLIAERFADTWTKLRVFELYKIGKWDKICYLDADMILCQNMDHVFSKSLPDQDWIAANHACVCNLDKDPWAPSDWNRDNCAYTPLSRPTAIEQPTPVTKDARPTYHLLNSGMFLFHSSESLWNRMIDFFNTTPLLAEFQFPDQDFLAEFFRFRWISLGWQFNALKTMQYWHSNIWQDDQVVCLHYIVDKPWTKRVSDDGVAGYLGRDGVTHTWWWNEYEDWTKQRTDSGDTQVIDIVKKYVASSGHQEDEQDKDMLALGSNVQAFANNKSAIPVSA